MFLAICLFLLYDFIQMNVMNSLSEAIISEFVMTHAQFGIVSSIYFYSNVLLVLVAGFLLDRYRSKRVILSAMLVSLLGTLAFLLSKNLMTLVSWRLCAGVAGAFSIVGSIKLLSTKYLHKQMAFLVGLLGFVIMLGGLIAQKPALFILNNYGLNYVIAGIIVFGVFAMAIFYFAINNESIAINNCQKLNWQNLINTFSRENNWCVAFYAGFMNFPLIVLGAALGNVWLNERFAFNIKSTSISSLLFIGNLIGAPVIGFISDHLTARKISMLVCAVAQLITYLLLYYLMIVANSHQIYLFYIFLIIGFFSGAQSLAYALITEINPLKNRAKAISLVSVISMVVGIVCQPLFGYLMNSKAEYKLILGIGVLTIFVTFFTQEKIYSPLMYQETS